MCDMLPTACAVWGGHSWDFVAIIVAPESMEKHASATKLQVEAAPLGSGSSEPLAHSQAP